MTWTTAELIPERATSPAARPAVRAGHLRVAVVGATGAVGRTLLDLMAERGYRPGALELVASARSAGSTVTALDGEHPVHDLDHFDFSGVDLAFFSAGTATSAAHARRAAAAGAIVLDNTNAFRMDGGSPLVVPQVNGHLLAQRPASGIVANPNCSTIPLVRLLAPLQQRFGVRRVVVATYQAASGRGLRGIEELQDTARAVLAGVEPTAERFARPLAFDVLPAIDEFLPTGFTLEEQKMRQEARKILAAPGLDLTATCVRVPVANGHSEAAHVDLGSSAELDDVLAALSSAAEVDVHVDDFPTPRTVTPSDHVHVGRVRLDPENPRRLAFWLVADNLRIGAALNAIQIAEELCDRGTL
jgi:aspartate-semialdehyde dehydrogenase